MLKCIICLLLPMCFSSTLSAQENILNELMKSSMALLAENHPGTLEWEVMAYLKKEESILKAFKEMIEKCIKSQTEKKKQNDINMKACGRDMSKFNTFYREFKKASTEYVNAMGDIIINIKGRIKFVDFFFLKNSALHTFCDYLAMESISMDPKTDACMIRRMNCLPFKAFYCIHELGRLVAKEDIINWEFSNVSYEEFTAIKMLKECADKYSKNVSKIIADSNNFKQGLTDSTVTSI